MVHDPSAETPRCRLQEEDSEEYGPPIVPETAVAAAIKAMTDEHLACTGGSRPEPPQAPLCVMATPLMPLPSALSESVPALHIPASTDALPCMSAVPHSI